MLGAGIIQAMIRGAHIAVAIWYLVLVAIGIFMLPLFTAWVFILFPPDPASTYFRLKFLVLHEVLPSMLVGLTLGMLAAVPTGRRHWATTSFPAVIVTLFYVVFQEVTYMVGWSMKSFLEIFIPTWVPLVGCSLLAGYVMSLVRRRQVKAVP